MGTKKGIHRVRIPGIAAAAVLALAISAAACNDDTGEERANIQTPGTEFIPEAEAYFQETVQLLIDGDRGAYYMRVYDGRPNMLDELATDRLIASLQGCTLDRAIVSALPEDVIPFVGGNIIVDFFNSCGKDGTTNRCDSIWQESKGRVFHEPVSCFSQP